jgi:hypothetical protein
MKTIKLKEGWVGKYPENILDVENYTPQEWMNDLRGELLAVVEDYEGIIPTADIVAVLHHITDGLHNQ